MTTHRTKPRHVLDRRALRRYLIDRDLTQDDFAETLGISTSYLDDLLDGRKDISPRNLFSIAEETAMDVGDLVVKVDEWGTQASFPASRRPRRNRER